MSSRDPIFLFATGTPMDQIDTSPVEPDPRFPSGPWTGFFAQRIRPGRNTMNMDVHFGDGCLAARGRDDVGAFTFQGSYDSGSGKCSWTKQYVGKHSVSYSGINEGQGIWGAWEINLLWGLYRDRGVFHIWPEGMTPTEDADLTERAFPPNAGISKVRGLVGVAILAAIYVAFRFFLAPLIERLLR
jgi:hypothetical protein